MIDNWIWLPEPIREVLALGGIVTLLLLLLSIISVAVIVYKSVEIMIARRRGKRRALAALRLWEAGQRQDALATLESAPRGIARLVRTTMELSIAEKPEAMIREEIQRIASSYLESLRKQLKTLEVIGSISPLMGLFGTVLGMIAAFKGMEAAGSQVDPSVLSGGIWQALLTTGVGLAVAIPTVLAHQWLERRVEVHGYLLEDAITRLFTADLRLPSQRDSSSHNRKALHAA